MHASARARSGLPLLSRTYERNAFDRFGCGRRWVSNMDLVELAPSMGPAGDLVNGSSFVKMMEAGIRTGLQRALVELEVLPGTLTVSIGRVSEPHCGRGRIARRPIIANIGPESSGLGLAVAGLEHRDRGVVSMQLACRQNVIAYSFNQWSQQLCHRQLKIPHFWAFEYSPG